MAATHTTAVAVFENRARAEEAVTELKKMGFNDEQIGIVALQDENDPNSKVVHEDGSHAGEGAAAGAAAGLGLGALGGLAVVTGVIPALGPALIGGWLGSILTSAAAGAATGGLVGALAGAGVPEEHATYYESELKSGRTIVTVHADAQYDDVRSTMHRYDGYDYDSRPNA